MLMEQPQGMQKLMGYSSSVYTAISYETYINIIFKQNNKSMLQASDLPKLRDWLPPILPTYDQQPRPLKMST